MISAKCVFIIIFVIGLCMMSRNDFVEKQLLFVNAREGEAISFSNQNIVIKNADGKIKHQSTCYLIFSLYIIGNFTITSVMLEKAKKFGFSIVILKTNFRVVEVLNNGIKGNTLLRKKTI